MVEVDLRPTWLQGGCMSQAVLATVIGSEMAMLSLSFQLDRLQHNACPKHTGMPQVT